VLHWNDLRRLDFIAAVALFVWAFLAATILEHSMLARFLSAEAAWTGSGIALARWVGEVRKAAKSETPAAITDGDS